MRLVPACKPVFDSDKERVAWPNRWIKPSSKLDKSYTIAYRLCFQLEESTRLRVHVSADQRYRFFVDGKRQGEGPERGDMFNWFYQSFDLELSEGSHCLTALVWTLESVSGIIPGAQISLHHGFMLAADHPHTMQVSTGLANWEFRAVEGVTFRSSGLRDAGELSGATVRIDGMKFPWGIERGEGIGWQPAISGGAARGRLGNDNWGVLNMPLLQPGILPPSPDAVRRISKIRYVGNSPPNSRWPIAEDAARLPEEEQRFADTWRKGESVQIPAKLRIWVLFDLEDYYCGFPELKLSNGRGAEVDVLWAESLFSNGESPEFKGNRDEVRGKTFVGRGDTFRSGGGSQVSSFTPFWWSCGRYVALFIRTADEPLTLYPLQIRESRYPLEAVGNLQLSNDDFERGKKLMWRSVQMCAHETYIDCPYYEQMNYTGDTRIQSLVTYLVSGDARLAKRCIELFASSVLPVGMTSARYPAECAQVIPQFSLYWVAMLHDYAVWRGESEWLRPLFPRMRFVLDTFLDHVDNEGLLHCPDGWNWVDWAWRDAEGRRTEFSAVNQLQLIYVLRLAMELERWIGRRDTADHYDCERKRLWDCAVKQFWCEKRGLFAASESKDVFGEHEQCFAILGGLLTGDRREALEHSLVESADLQRATSYFQHYLFESFTELGRQEEIIKRLGAWGKMVDLGLMTTPERTEQDRSDCHAWSSHPLYHAAVSIGGIQPVSFGFERVNIVPAVDAMTSANISIPHRLGPISVSWKRESSETKIIVEIPEGLSGTLELRGIQEPLSSGRVVKIIQNMDTVPEQVG